MDESTQLNELSREIEVLLFAYGEAMTPEKISKVLSEVNNRKVIVDDVAGARRVLDARLSREESGLSLMQSSEGVQLGTKPFGKEIIQHLTKAELNENLTPAAVETLSIIAYIGPVPRSTIDYIRGVNSSFILRTLLIRGLIDREPDPLRAQSYCYSASLQFLKHIGLSKTGELPEYEAFKEAVKAMQAQSAKTEATEQKTHEQI